MFIVSNQKEESISIQRVKHYSVFYSAVVTFRYSGKIGVSRFRENQQILKKADSIFLLVSSELTLLCDFIYFRAIINHFTPKVDSWAAVNHLSSLTEDQVSSELCRLSVS